MSTFNTTDFVQVEHNGKLGSKEPIKFWRNALYVCVQDSKHVVIYTDGQKEILNEDIKIRAVSIKNNLNGETK